MPFEMECGFSEIGFYRQSQCAGRASSLSYSCDIMGRFKPGDLIERDIEGMWFKGMVIELGPTGKLTIQYFDDENVEKDVSASECRATSEDNGTYETKGDNEGKGDADSHLGTKLRVVKKGDTLMKPLAGMIDDDCEERGKLIPKSIVHTSDDTEDGRTILLHGAEQEMAAGGGLRALRFLGGRAGRK